MEPTHPLKRLLWGLDTLQRGDRFWYWLCLEPQPGFPPILISPLRDDPDMGKLESAAATIPLLLGATPAIGLGAIAADGRLQLHGPQLTAAMLEDLAAWCTDNVSEHPGLSILWGLGLVVVDRGRVVERIDSPEAWEWVPRGHIPGTTGHTAGQLARLREDEGAWFWLADRAPRPLLALRLLEGDPDGEAFARLVDGLRLLSPDAPELLGVAWRRSSGLILATTAPSSGWEDILHTAWPAESMRAVTLAARP
jgi:hypothetical protein